MVPFRFRLATLLRLRESLRDEKRGQLAEAYQAAQILTERLQMVDEELQGMRRQLAKATEPGRVDVDQLLSMHRYDRLLGAQRQLIEQQQRQIAEEIERRRLAVVEADRQVRVLEKLREVKRGEHEYAAARQEMKQMDELAARARPYRGEAE